MKQTSSSLQDHVSCYAPESFVGSIGTRTPSVLPRTLMDSLTSILNPVTPLRRTSLSAQYPLVFAPSLFHNATHEPPPAP